MTSDVRRRRSGGFTLVELVVVLAVVGLLVGTAVPLVDATLDAERRNEVEAELGAIATALEDYWYDNASFPAALDDASFVGPYLLPGVRDSAVFDSWGGGGQLYRYVVTRATAGRGAVATVYSLDRNARDDGAANEALIVRVHASVPGARKTRQRMRLIAEQLAAFLEGGGTLTGVWATDRVLLGLGTTYGSDGFGNAFRLDATSLTLSSDGPDGVAGNTDDLVY